MTDSKKDAALLLKADHAETDKLLGGFKTAEGRQQRRQLIEKIASALAARALLDEEILHPTCREKGVEASAIEQSQVRHDTLKLLVADLLRGSQDHDYYEAKVAVLGDYLKHHVGKEEDASEGILARARSAGVDMEALGEKLQARKDELTADTDRLLARPPKIRSLNLSQLHQEYGDMARYPTDRYRDEESRPGAHRHPGRDYRGGYDEDFGPNRDSYGQSDYTRSSHGYHEGDQPPRNYRGGYGDSEAGYSENTEPSYNRGLSRPDRRHIEQSASGGRYRLDPDRRDGDGERRGAGRYIGGERGEDREYYQGTRYGSSHGGGRYSERQDDHDRYYSGSDHDERRAPESRRSDYGSGDYRRRGPGGSDRDGRYEGSGPGFRGNR